MLRAENAPVLQGPCGTGVPDPAASGAGDWAISRTSLLSLAGRCQRTLQPHLVSAAHEREGQRPARWQGDVLLAIAEWGAWASAE